MPSTSRNMLVGISSTIAMIGPSFSVATEKRSSVSRAPVRSSELTSTRQRSHRKAWKIRPTSEPVQVGGGPFAADELDEELLERALAQRTGADLVDAPLRDEAPVGDHPDVRRQTLDDLEDVRGEEDRPAARHEGMQQVFD